jgi:hypothetical protein
MCHGAKAAEQHVHRDLKAAGVYTNPRNYLMAKELETLWRLRQSYKIGASSATMAGAFPNPRELGESAGLETLRGAHFQSTGERTSDETRA